MHADLDRQSIANEGWGQLSSSEETILVQFLTYRCIEETRSNLFHKRETILYPAFDFYPGGSGALRRHWRGFVEV